jgi:hypothetical protein
MNAPVNKEGLTFYEWYNAATRWDEDAVSYRRAKRAWERGEDPTEYAVRKL